MPRSPKTRARNNEERIRVICHLPVNNSSQERVLVDFIKLLNRKRQRAISAKRGLTGYTLSNQDPPCFRGMWWSASSLVEDKIVLCLIDYIPLQSQEPTYKIARELKDALSRLYKKHYQKQEEIWVVSHHITRPD